MENLGMMPHRASPRPPWRVALAWRGSSEFERCGHDADHSPEVCRLSPASPCSRSAGRTLRWLLRRRSYAASVADVGLGFQFAFSLVLVGLPCAMLSEVRQLLLEC